ncbi:hypothetical protein [Ramlibacter alkalitolerans]|uniref:DUF3618 domain-containing protein n=1 Tax=Ramlibacter alkalitolerans TaxID=2039631 RepID=A0ABS1JJL4_9BURK|nr:hypothetical protein [Ramlibacter alkalitolerans]MBL0424404.1 hypothetical protein [Ramlibacter alkalitolerans]
MPHSRKLMKVTGDTHPPEVEDDLGGPDEEIATAEAATPAVEGAAPVSGRPGSGVRSLVVSMPAREYVDTAREQVRARPLTTAAIAFFAGFAIAVVTRSR